MLPHWYLEGRLVAQYHAQVELPEPVEIPRAPAALTLRGKVVRVFRVDAPLAIGADVCFEIQVRPRDGEPIAGERQVLVDEVQGARYLEIFFDRRPWYSKDRIVRNQLAKIDAPTDAPTLKVPTPQEVAARNPLAGIDRLDIV